MCVVVIKCSICKRDAAINLGDGYTLCVDCAKDQIEQDRRKIRVYEKLLDFIINGDQF